MVDVAYDVGGGCDRWSIPDDRQLALRGRLQTGWSSYRQDIFSSTKKIVLTDDEQKQLQTVLVKRDKIEGQDQQRIGNLVTKLEQMRSNVHGDGQTTCLICGTKAGLLKDQLRYCAKCSKMVCPKCSLETKLSLDTSNNKSYFCVLCNEERQLWKRSGAWFFNTMPKYTIPENGINDFSRGTFDRNSGSVYSARGAMGKASSYLDLHRNDDHDSGDEASDSDVDEPSFTKTFDIKSHNSASMSWHAGLEMEEDTNQVRRNALSNDTAESRKPVATKTSSLEHSAPEDDVVDGSNIHQVERRYNGSTTSLNETNGQSASDRRGSMSSLSSGEGGKHERKHKLNIRKVLRKYSKESNEERSPNFDKSPLSSKKTFTNGNDMSPPGDSVSQDGSEQDIDAMFKDYEDEQSRMAEFTGKLGMIEFTLQYDANTQELLVIVHSCKGLKDAKGKTPTLPYVKTYILPEAAKATKKRTSAIKKLGDPVYNETLVYHGISDTDIQQKGLRLSVIDEHKLGAGLVIGETSIPLKNLANRPVQQFRRILDPRSNDEALFLDTKNTVSDPGRIELALHYLSKQGKLVVGIIRCAGLKSMDPNGYSDPYVKCYLLPDPLKKTKKKTQVKKKTLNPEFNEEFSFSIPHSELAKRTLYVSVWDHDVGRSNDFIGGIMFGIESSVDLLRHWLETLRTQDRRVIKWHTLSDTCPIIH